MADTESVVYSYDRMQGVNNQESEEWKGECIYCGGTNLNISPLNISYQQPGQQDYSDLPEEVRERYKNLPTLIEAVLLGLDGEKNIEIIVECEDDGHAVLGFYNNKEDYLNNKQAKVNKAALKKYLHEYHNVEQGIRL